MCFTIIIYLYRNDPELLAERYKKPGTGNQKGWDKYFVSILLIAFITWIVIMPLDSKRYGWTRYFPVWLKVVGGIVLLFSFFIDHILIIHSFHHWSEYRLNENKK